MTKTITRLFDSQTHAFRALDELERAGIDHDRISVVSNNTESWHAGHKHYTEQAEALDVDSGAAKGARAGSVIGGASGFAAGLSVMAIPGLGAAAIAGWLLASLAGTVIGVAAGGAAGGLIGALKDAGHSEEEAHVYSEGVRRGGALISVKVDEDHAAQVEQILDGQLGVDAATRGKAYRESGWTRHEPDAQPYTAEQIVSERRRYQEDRSFAGDDTDPETEADRVLRSGGVGIGSPGASGPD